MFDSTSRYYSLETGTAEILDDKGEKREVKYVRRRFIPSPDNSIVFQEHLVADGERPDTLAALYLHDPTLFWQLCDANTVMQPEELTEEPGATVEIPTPSM